MKKTGFNTWDLQNFLKQSEKKKGLTEYDVDDYFGENMSKVPEKPAWQKAIDKYIQERAVAPNVSPEPDYSVGKHSGQIPPVSRKLPRSAYNKSPELPPVVEPEVETPVEEAPTEKSDLEERLDPIVFNDKVKVMSEPDSKLGRLWDKTVSKLGNFFDPEHEDFLAPNEDLVRNLKGNMEKRAKEKAASVKNWQQAAYPQRKLQQISNPWAR